MTATPSAQRSPSPALRCPACRTDLAEVVGPGWRTFRCATCEGVAVPLASLRKVAAAKRVAELWSRLPRGVPGRPCPECARRLTEVGLDAPPDGARLALDVCRICQVAWFDAHELGAFAPPDESAPLPSESRPAPLSPRAAEALVRAEFEGEETGNRALKQATTAVGIVVMLLRILGALAR